MKMMDISIFYLMRDNGKQVRAEISKHNAVLADALKQLLDDYEYDEILRIIREATAEA